MDQHEPGTTSLCKKVQEVPPVYTEWQQPVWCPDCDYYKDGKCGYSLRTESGAACPFDDQVLPLRDATVERPSAGPRSLIDVGSCDVRPCDAQKKQPRFEAMEHAVERRIKDRTGGRIHALMIELTDSELVVRGTAPCFYLKQLALHAALDFLRSTCDIAVALRLEVDVALGPAGQLGRGDAAESYEECR